MEYTHKTQHNYSFPKSFRKIFNLKKIISRKATILCNEYASTETKMKLSAITFQIIFLKIDN